LFKQAQDFAAAKILRIGELKRGLRRGVTFQKSLDVSFELGGVALERVV
jgi:hypothetical protein